MLTATPPPPLREPETEITPIPSIASSTPPLPPRPQPGTGCLILSSAERANAHQRAGSEKTALSSVDAVETPLGRYSGLDANRLALCIFI